MRLPSAIVEFTRLPFLRHLAVRGLALLALALVPCLGSPANTTPESSDRLIVRWRSAPDAQAEVSEARRLGERTGQAVARSRHIGGRLSVLQLEQARSGEGLKATMAALLADPEIEMVEVDRRVRAHAYAPSDPLFANQWYLKGVEPAAVRADTAWDTTRGGASPASSAVVVAVLDTGVRFEHPDLRRASEGGKLLPGYDFVSGETSTTFATSNDGDGWDPDPSDPGDFMSAADLASDTFKNKGCGGGDSQEDPTASTWHGTRVSGMIAADTNNAMGIAGAGFNIRILPVRVLGKCGGFDSDVIAGMYWAAGMLVPPALLVNPQLPANPYPAQIINMSLGGKGPCDAKYTTAISDITAHGVLVVVSSGNQGEAVASPANCVGALGVAGLRHIGTKVGYSNLGTEVGIAAPAGNCVNIAPGSPCLFSLDTTVNDGATTPGNSTYTNQFNTNLGTSFAAPLVSGAAGLMKATNPSLTPVLLIARIRETARAFPVTSDNPGITVCQNPSVVPLQETECICTTALCGAGMLDAGRAVIAAQRPVALAEVIGTVGVGRTLTLDGAQSGAASGRMLVSYRWTVVGTAGGAAMPTIRSAKQAIASVKSPVFGSYTLRLSIADNLGATDSAEVTVNAANSGGDTSGTSPPPDPDPQGGGGGGGTAPGLLVLLLLLASARKWT